MAGATAALNNYFINAFSLNQMRTREALNDQGLDSFTAFVTLTFKDIHEICSNCKAPGGTLPNPRAAEVGQHATISNRGVAISLVVEKNLQKLRSYLNYIHMIQRLHGTASPTVGRINIAHNDFLRRKDFKNDTIDLPAPFTKVEKIRQTLEALDEVLCQRLGGTSYLPLAYVTRTNVALPGDPNVPAVTAELDPGVFSPSCHEEMIRRGRHTGEHYEEDNTLVWHIMFEVFGVGPGKTWIQPYKKSRD